MVVKERIVVDLVFTEVKTCVNTVKDWFVSKGYKKITSRNPDRWSTAVILDIAKGGLMSKVTVQTSFKSHAGGNSIMLEFVASNDGTGLSGKPVMSAAPDPKDKPYEALAMDLSKFVKSTWKRGAGPGLEMMPAATPSYQTSAPASGGYRSPLLSGSQDYSSQQSYGSDQQYNYQEQAQTGYDASGGYQQEQQPAYDQQQYQQEQPAAVQPAPEPAMSDEEIARIETEMAADDAKAKAEMEAARAALQAEVAPAQVEEPKVEAPPVEPAPPVPEPIVEAPVPEPQPPVYEPPPQVEPAPAPVEPEPAPEAPPAPIVGPTAPTPSPSTETFCPGCGKKTKPKWKTCPYCEHDLMGTKAEATAVQPEAVPTPVAEQPAAQPEEKPAEVAPQVEQQSVSAGEATATCPVCTGCGQPPTWIEDYKRYYCYACQKYV